MKLNANNTFYSIVIFTIVFRNISNNVGNTMYLRGNTEIKLLLLLLLLYMNEQQSTEVENVFSSCSEKKKKVMQLFV